MCNLFIGLGGPPCSRHLLNIRCGAKGGCMLQVVQHFFHPLSHVYLVLKLSRSQGPPCSEKDCTVPAEASTSSAWKPVRAPRTRCFVYRYIYNTYIHMYMFVPGLRYLGLGTQGERRRRAALEFGVIWVPGLGYLGLDTYSWWRTRAILESQAMRVLGLRHRGLAQSSFLPSEYILET